MKNKKVQNGKKNARIPLIASIPHSGVKIPPEAHWLKQVNSHILMCDVDDLYTPVLEELQIPSIIFKWHRYSIDVNRYSRDISPLTVKMSKWLLKTKKNRR